MPGLASLLGAAAVLDRRRDRGIADARRARIARRRAAGAAIRIRATPCELTLLVHVLAGALGLLSGYVALAVSKGAPLHRKTGMFFVYVMVTMSITGRLVSAVRGVAPAINIPTALLTFYLVITGMTSVGSPAVVVTTLRCGRDDVCIRDSALAAWCWRSRSTGRGSAAAILDSASRS